MRRIDCEQGSADWLTIRCGKITASEMCSVLAKLKTKPKDEAKDRWNYKIQIVAERLTGDTRQGYFSWYMREGRELEPFARAEYEVLRGVDCDQTGFVIHPYMDYSGASPDGLLEDGGLECKCPKAETHIKWMLDGIVPVEYAPQCYWNMACTGAKWWDFCSHVPRLPKKLRTFIVRLHRNDKVIAAMEEEVSKFNQEVLDVIESLTVRAEQDPLEITEADIQLHS